MIKFEGALSGEAKSRFFERIKSRDSKILLIPLVSLFPLVVFFSFRIDYLATIIWYLIPCFVAYLVTRFPKSAKEQSLLMPRCICIDREKLICTTGKSEEVRLFDDVKEVLDCKSYYEIVFRFGKISTNYICQKDLLIQGTIQEFEELFKDKMEDMTDYFE